MDKKQAEPHHGKVAEAADKQKKKEEEEAMKKEKHMPSLKEDINKGIKHMYSLPIKQMKELL